MASPTRSSPEMITVPVSHRPVRFTNTAVPRFNGDTCWYQHQQVFDAIAKSNGWDDETAALQVFAHLEGDALNVAKRSGLAGALSDWRSTAVRRDGEGSATYKGT